MGNIDQYPTTVMDWGKRNICKFIDVNSSGVGVSTENKRNRKIYRKLFSNYVIQQVVIRIWPPFKNISIVVAISMFWVAGKYEQMYSSYW